MVVTVPRVDANSHCDGALPDARMRLNRRVVLDNGVYALQV